MNRYGAPTTYNRITPDRGCGFILKRIWDLTEDPTNTCPPSLPTGPHPTKQDVYVGSPFNYRPGWNSSCWAALVRDGLIESDDGMQEYKYYSFYKNSHVGTRAAGHYEAGNGYTVRYHLTPKGNGILIDMMERRVLQKAAKQDFCERNRIEFGTGRLLNTVGSVAEHDAKKDEKYDILQKEAVDCAKLAADYAGENQKLRAEKNDTNERLKKLYGRLIVLETTIHQLQDEVAALAWNK